LFSRLEWWKLDPVALHNHHDLYPLFLEVIAVLSYHRNGNPLATACSFRSGGMSDGGDKGGFCITAFEPSFCLGPTAELS